MRRKFVLLFIIVFCFTINISASSGKIRQDSIIECNGRYYGNHGNPSHWHIVEKKDNTWVSISGEVDIPACYIKPLPEKEKVVFNSCIDGDTAKFIIRNEKKIVRFLAINTPEIGEKLEPFGIEASNYTCESLKMAKEIYLEYDGNDKEDKYGRILAFIWVDGELLEEKLIEQGLGKVAYVYGDYAHVDKLREAESYAKNAEKGIWSKEIVLGNKEEKIHDFEENREEKTFWEEILSFIINLLLKIFDLI